MPADWAEHKLEDMVEVLDHMRMPVNSDERAKRPGVVPYYGANGQQGWIDRPLFDEPLILLAEDGGNFDDFRVRPIAYRIDGPSWVNNHAHILRALHGVDQSFIFWSVVHKDIRRYIAGGTRSKLTQAELRSIEVPAPPLPEQRRIAEILDTLDEAIRKTEQVIAKLQQMKQGLLHDLLTRGIDEHGELRDPDRHPEQFQDSPLGRIPREWKPSTVGQACSIHNNLRKPIASDVRERMQGPYPYYGPTGVLDHLNEYRVEGRYVLIGEDGDHFLKFASWPMTLLVEGRFNVNNHAHILTGFGDCSTEWVHRFFLHRDITLFTTRQGAGRFKLNKASLKTLPIAVPPPSEQKLIVERFQDADSLVDGEIAELQKLHDLKHGLMDDLLTGRVRVTMSAKARAEGLPR